MDDRLRSQAIARGYLTRAQIIDAGYRDRDIKVALRVGLLVRLRHGIYAYTDDVAGLDELALHRLLSYAVVDRLGEGFVLSHQSACAAHGIDLYGLPDRLVHVTRLDGRAGRREAGVVHHVGHVPPEDVVVVDGRTVMVPERAVFELATIGRTETGVVAASSALHLGLVNAEGLAEMAERLERWQGARHAALAFRLADGRCESVGESRSLFMVWRGGLPRPEQQVSIQGPFGVVARVDFDWDAWRHTGEFDGLFKYGRLNPYGSDPGRVLEDEKAREDAVRGTGRGMSRWIWPDLPLRQTVERLRADLDRSRSLYCRGRMYINLG
ncbi:type IV toxin-antitoxin system AbiEi family antitoxin domain-containing protein [Aeromicrobium ginsengisoli]|uniref:Type IV toxin-antitoxin system AbiEi family antitoxin domain-containing protein n=1 Tax=Aeromicrobium ginsengisoli TaxID=363867 RepID=A0A5M4FIA0_9ACTN|nr:type IV toxin-antitoxin system AbiEi family antitoxin domain-containing protein [Aeromicrobium ginsengisoli]KAA1399688.1 type IV toxin-antitoxin system AbiEi family antitoxin domain-containing protein [Aeromicrobium ginsengisoli]